MTGSTNIVFVGGCPRSGTSGLSHAIAQCPGYATGPESHLLYYLLRPSEAGTKSRFHSAFDTSAHPGSWLKENDIVREDFFRQIEGPLRQLFSASVNGKIWVDSSPENLLVGEALLDIFENCRFVAVLRNPLEVCRSMLMSGFPFPWAKEVDKAIEVWSVYARQSLKLMQKDDPRFLAIKQSDMKNNPDETARILADFFYPGAEVRIANFLEAKPINSSFDLNSQLAIGTAKGVQSTGERKGISDEDKSIIIDKCGDLAKSLGV